MYERRGIRPNFHASQDFVVDVKEMFNVNLNTRANMNVVVIKFYDFRKVLYSCCSGSLTFVQCMSARYILIV